MLKLEALPEHIISALKKRGHDDEAIRQMQPQQAFVEYCRWHGLSDWGHSLWADVQVLKESEAKA